jgi:hypothetical protein
LYNIELQRGQVWQWRKSKEMLGGIEEFLYGCKDVQPGGAAPKLLESGGGATDQSVICFQAFSNSVKSGVSPFCRPPRPMVRQR